MAFWLAFWNTSFHPSKSNANRSLNDFCFVVLIYQNETKKPTKNERNRKEMILFSNIQKKYTMHQFYVAEFGRIGAKVNWDLAFCGYANDKKKKVKKKQCKRPRKTTGTHSIETDSNLMWLSTTFFVLFLFVTHFFYWIFPNWNTIALCWYERANLYRIFSWTKTPFFNTSMASRRMEYIYYNAMMTNAIGFVWIHIDRSFSPFFEGIWTNTQQIPWVLRFCFIFYFC